MEWVRQLGVKLARRLRANLALSFAACGITYDDNGDPGEFSRGFALLIVLVVVLALSLMFGAMLQSSQQDADEASRRVEQVKETAALDGALVSAAYDLSLARQQVSFGTAERVQIGEYSVTVTIRPELSKLDINYAAADDLRKLLEAAGVATERASALSNGIVAWRNGAYGSVVAQNPAGPPARPFETVADLALVANGEADLAACLEPDVTVFTRTSGVNAFYASQRLRQAVYGNTQQPDRPPSYDSVVGGEAARPDLYEITEEIRGSNRQAIAHRQTVIRVTGDERRPLWILAQASPGPNEDSAVAACQRLARHVH